MKRYLIIAAIAAALSASLSAAVTPDLPSWVPARFAKARQTPVIEQPLFPWLLGLYDIQKGCIYVAPPYSENTLAHEVGHAVWYRDLSHRQRRQWVRLHHQNPDLLAVWIYEHDPPHSFAEAFAEFECTPGVMKKSAPKVYEWFVRLSAQ